MRVLWLLVVLGMATVAAAGTAEARAQSPERTLDKGVVQEVAPPRLVLRALDGSRLEFSVDRSTRVLVNGIRTRLAAVRPGFVAEVAHTGAGPALRVRAFGRVAAEERGVVVTLARSELVLQRDSGREVRIVLTRHTRVRRGGAPAGRWAIRPGRHAIVRLARDGSARVVIVRRA